MYARCSHVVVSQLIRWRQTSDSHTPNTRGIRSKCYISLITSSSFTRYGLAWSIKFELWCHIFTIFYKHDHWVPPLYRFSYQKHQTTCHVPLLKKWLNELISVWRLIINFPSICYKYFFPWKYKANSSPHLNIVNVASTKICSYPISCINSQTHCKGPAKLWSLSQSGFCFQSSSFFLVMISCLLISCKHYSFISVLSTKRKALYFLSHVQ